MKKNKLNILWTNSNVNTSKSMVLMYGTASANRSWYDEVHIIIWGDTARLVAENKDIQLSIEIAKNNGVKFTACMACASQLGVIDKLQNLNIDLKYMGERLTEIIKDEEYLITI